MKLLQLFALVLFVSFPTKAQHEDAWVFFVDKPSESTFLQNPESMLSVRSLERKERHGIAVDSKDVPIEAAYLMDLQVQTGIQIMAKSKWMNAVHIQGDYNDILSLLSLNYVDKIEFANKTIGTVNKPNEIQQSSKQKDKLKYNIDYEYGATETQVTMLGVEVLHQNDHTGDGMLIAVMDAGFPNVDNYPAFKNLRDKGQILGGYDFVNRSDDFYSGHSHGMSVLSTIGGFIENSFVGTAPDASFYLFITEDDSKETPLEESLWVEAAERADSLGVDIINTSLGYTQFDDSSYNYTNDDLDGNTTFISRGAEIAFSRGMMVVNSAGNEGNDPWHFISAPADAEHVLSIGAVNGTGQIAPFSSFGPTADGRVKPDVLAQGWGVYVIGSNGAIGASAGTSFSSPVMAGAIASLWSAFPDLTNLELMNLIREAGHLFNAPTAQHGYGIPNFAAIFEELSAGNTPGGDFVVFPNPSADEIKITLETVPSNAELSLFNELGQIVMKQQMDPLDMKVTITHLNNGLYFGRLVYDGSKSFFKVLKIDE